MSKKRTIIRFSKKTVLLFFGLVMLITLNAEKYAGEIFKMGAGVRNYAMGRTGLTDDKSPALAYWNASLLTELTGSNFELLHADEYSGNLQYDVISGNLGDKNKVAFTLARIGINDIDLTKIPNPDSLPSNDNRPFSYKSVNNADYVLYIGFARKIRENLSLGLTPKIAYRNLAEETAYGVGMDFSGLWKIDTNLDFGFRVRDIFTTQIFWENGTQETVNPGLDLEGSWSFTVPKVKKEVKLIANTEINTEGMNETATLSAGALSMDYHLGAEIKATQNINLYLGYDIDNLTTGISFYLKNWNVNYSFEYDNELDNSHRISLGINF